MYNGRMYNMPTPFTPGTLLYLYKLVLLQLLWLQQFHSQPCFYVGWDLCL